ncbi:MAG: class II SORL domain-containing protein [Candidatus Latescibacteria bacterium]|nr:class II SORL domain-containing protein [Candidatus Latescibacterota bacterium]
MGKEKHVPIIDAPSSVSAGQAFDVTVSVGKVVPHPNTVEHHIKWIQLYALPEGSRYVIELGKFDFGPTVAQPKVTVPVILQKNSTIYAVEHCNIHGLWDYSVKVQVS